MSTNNLINKIEELNSWEELLEEAKATIEAIKDDLKAEMLERNTEELEAGQYIIRWTSVTTNRFDSASFKRNLPEVYKAYLKQSISKRFSISASLNKRLAAPTSQDTASQYQSGKNANFFEPI